MNHKEEMVRHELRFQYAKVRNRNKTIVNSAIKIDMYEAENKKLSRIVGEFEVEIAGL